MEPHKLKEHKCDVKSCKIGFKRIYSYIMVVYANCKDAY